MEKSSEISCTPAVSVEVLSSVIMLASHSGVMPSQKILGILYLGLGCGETQIKGVPMSQIYSKTETVSEASLKQRCRGG